MVGAGLPALAVASPTEFDGPGDEWSPETLLTASLAGCFILTFRAIARASKLTWTSLHCEVTGVLDRVERVTQFVSFDVTVRLELPPGADEALALRALEKVERTCLISSSLKGPVHLHPQLVVAPAAVG